MEYSDFLDVAKEAASLAGEILLEAWDKPRTVKHKGTVDLVRRTTTSELFISANRWHMDTAYYVLFDTV